MKLSRQFILGFLASFSWAVFIIIERGLLKNGENPYALLFWIELLSFPLWLILSLRNRKDIKLINTKVIVSLFTIGVFGAIGTNLLEYLALQSTTAINFSLLNRTVIVFTFIFAYFAFHEKITLKKIILSILIIAGSFLLITNGQGIRLMKGDIYTILEAACIAFVNNILIKFTVSKIHPDLSAAVSYYFALIPILLLSYFNQGLNAPKSWFWVICLVVLSIAISQFRNRGYKIATASFMTMMMSFTSVSVAILSLIFLGESISLIQLAGGILIVSSGIMAEKLKI